MHMKNLINKFQFEFLNLSYSIVDFYTFHRPTIFQGVRFECKFSLKFLESKPQVLFGRYIIEIHNF